MGEAGVCTLEDNEVFANKEEGILIQAKARAVLRRNRVHHSATGILATAEGSGILDRNGIFENTRMGVEIREGGNLQLLHNRITGNGIGAIYVHDAGGGTLRDNDLRGSGGFILYIANDSKSRVIEERNLTD